MMKTKYIDQLIKDCQLAKTAIPVRVFDMAAASDLSVLDGIKKAVYVFYSTNITNEQMFEDLKEYKAITTRACPKINTPNNVMYVGSSTTNIKTRIKSHKGLDGGKGGTSALQLKYWFKGDYRIKIYVYEKESKSVIQLIEDNLSHNLKPAFGKMGSNNK